MSRVMRLLIIVIGLATVVAANVEAGIAVTPARHVLELNPEEAAYAEYQVYNSGPEPIDIVIEPQDLAKLKENKDIDINSWLTVKENKITVEVGQTKAMGINVKVPKNAIGELDSMLYLCYKEQKDSILNIRYGTPLYVLVKGTEKIKAEIESVEIVTGYNPVLKQKQLVICVKVSNLGNRHIIPNVWAIVKDIKSNKEEKIMLDKPWPVFGGQDYLYNIIWDNYNLEPGEHKATAFFDYGKNNILEYSVLFNINEKGEIGQAKKK